MHLVLFAGRPKGPLSLPLNIPTFATFIKPLENQRRFMFNARDLEQRNLSVAAIRRVLDRGDNARETVGSDSSSYIINDPPSRRHVYAKETAGRSGSAASSSDHTNVNRVSPAEEGPSVTATAAAEDGATDLDTGGEPVVPEPVPAVAADEPTAGDISIGADASKSILPMVSSY